MEKMICVFAAMCGICQAVQAAVCSAVGDADLARRVAEDVAKPVRPAGVNGQPFWNGSSWMFMYPPSFEFSKVPGAVKYRFLVIDDLHYTHTMDAQEPTALLVPIWGEIPARGFVTVICDGVDANGALCGRAGTRRFWKAAPFTPGGYPPAPRSYAEAAARTCDFMMALPNTRYLVEKGRPDPSYELNCYPAKMCGCMIDIMLRCARNRPDRADEAMKAARAAADYLLGISQGADTPLAHFPPTYGADYIVGGEHAVKTARKYAGQNMLLYPARVAQAYLRLSDATGDGKYAAAAENIARTYLKLQGEDGTWHLKLWERDGSPVLPNRAFPLEPLELFEAMYVRTRDPVFRAASDRAFEYIEKGPLTNWNWECQFEDVQPHQPYKALTKHQACSTAMFLLKRFPGDQGRLAQARELLRFSEDQFVYWERPCRADGAGYRTVPPVPDAELCAKMSWLVDYRNWITPGVGEQFGWEMPIDASNDKLIRTYVALYKAAGDPLDLAKARALGDTLVRVQKEDGSIRTQMLSRPDADNFWINCMGASIAALDLLSSL